MSLKKIDTPCIGICSTIYGDEICRGCKRTYQEVIDWNTYSEQQQSTVFNRLWDNIVKVCKDKIIVTNPTVLQAQCDKYNIRYSQQQAPVCLAFYLLREGHEKIQNIERYGVKICKAYAHLSLSDLYKNMDQQVLDNA